MSYSLSHDPPFSTIGLFTYKRTYARRVDELKANSEVETFQQTLNRVISASDTQLNCDFTDDEKREFYGLLYNLKCSVAGRFYVAARKSKQWIDLGSCPYRTVHIQRLTIPFVRSPGPLTR